MFNLQKSNQNQYPQEVLEIHHEFETAGEKLLAEAKQVIAQAETVDIQKGKRLFNLGFKNTGQAKSAIEIEGKKKMADKTKELVLYYAQKYPLNKFITEPMVKQICEKYGLVFGDTERYTGFVPEEKLRMIENFKVDEKDVPEFQFTITKGDNVLDVAINESDLTEYGIKYLKSFISDHYFYITGHKGDHFYIDRIITPEFESKFLGHEFVRCQAEEIKDKLKICAPLKEMDTRGMQVAGHKLIKHIPDPVVLKPVKGGYLIVCAWGDEASDPLVVNHVNN